MSTSTATSSRSTRSRQVASIVLPNNSAIKILAIDEIKPASPGQPRRYRRVRECPYHDLPRLDKFDSDPGVSNGGIDGSNDTLLCHRGCSGHAWARRHLRPGTCRLSTLVPPSPPTPYRLRARRSALAARLFQQRSTSGHGDRWQPRERYVHGQLRRRRHVHVHPDVQRLA